MYKIFIYVKCLTKCLCFSQNMKPEPNIIPHFYTHIFFVQFKVHFTFDFFFIFIFLLFGRYNTTTFIFCSVFVVSHCKVSQKILSVLIFYTMCLYLYLMPYFIYHTYTDTENGLRSVEATMEKYNLTIIIIIINFTHPRSS